MSEDWRVPVEDEDPLLRSARRELKVAVGFWLVFATWAIGLGKLLAYRKTPEGEMINMIMGSKDQTSPERVATLAEMESGIGTA